MTRLVSCLARPSLVASSAASSYRASPGDSYPTPLPSLEAISCAPVFSLRRQLSAFVREHLVLRILRIIALFRFLAPSPKPTCRAKPASWSIRSRRRVGLRSPLRAKSMMRTAITCFASLSSRNFSVVQTSSSAIDIAVMSLGSNTLSLPRMKGRMVAMVATSVPCDAYDRKSLGPTSHLLSLVGSTRMFVCNREHLHN